jgi:hypothetical protein
MRDKIGCRLSAGRFLYFGEHWLPFGDGVYDLPLSAMCRHAVLPTARKD